MSYNIVFFELIDKFSSTEVMKNIKSENSIKSSFDFFTFLLIKTIE